MSDFPKPADVSGVVINTSSIQSLGFHGRMHTGGISAATATWGGANTAIFVPFVIAVPTTIVKIFWFNHSIVSGNIDVGIYDSQGNKLVSSGSTAQSGTSAIQEVDITDTTLSPGLYYMAMVMDNTTGGVRRFAPDATACRAMGIYTMASAFPLPTTATFTPSTTAFFPIIALTTRGVV